MPFDLRRADDAEQRLTEELRRLGQEAMQGWAERQVRLTEQESGGFPQGLPDAVAPQQTRWRRSKPSLPRSTAPWCLPFVTPLTGADRRKGKSVQWQEAKVSLAHVHGSTEPVYGATLLGDVDTAGRQLRAWRPSVQALARATTCTA